MEVNSPQSSSLSDCEQKKGRWTQEEDDELRAAVDSLGEKQWKAVALRVIGRTPTQCLHRWNKILKPGLVKGPWTIVEDEALMEWVKLEGPTKWTICATKVPGRSGKQCRERWFNTLDPDVKKGDWQEAEDKIIFRLYHRVGPKWTEMAKYLPGRTDNSIKNRFYSTIRKAKNKTSETLFDPIAVPEAPIPASISLQVVTLLQQMQKLELLLSRTRQQVVYLEESISTEESTNRMLEDSSQELLV